MIRTDSCQEAADRIAALNVELARQLRELEARTRERVASLAAIR